MIPKEEIDLLSDQAIESSTNDKFNRKDFIETVSKIIHSQTTKVNPENNPDYKNIEENMIIGLYGAWGTGKSSIINLLRENLTSKKNVETSYFNPWIFQSESDLLQSLFKIITEKAKLTGQLKYDFVEILQKYKPLISTFSNKWGKSANSLLEFLTEKEETDPVKVRDQIDKFLQGKANPLVIFIDDVDRLSRLEIQILFKTLRLIASFKHVIYVVAFDIDMVAKSIKDNYVSGKEEDGYAFIEKIIQIPIHIPQIKSDDLYKFGLEYIKNTLDLNLSQNTVFKPLFYRHLQTPRDVKRFINGFRFTYHHFNNSIDPQDLISIELIRSKSPELFKIVKFYYNSISSLNPQETYKKEIVGFLKTINSDFIEANKQVDRTNQDLRNYNEVFKNLLGFYDISGLTYKDFMKQNGNNLLYGNYFNLPEVKELKNLKNPSIVKKYFELINEQNHEKNL